MGHLRPSSASETPTLPEKREMWLLSCSGVIPLASLSAYSDTLVPDGWPNVPSL